MILEPTFHKCLIGPISPEIGKQSIVFIPQLYVIGNAGFALHFNEIDKFISNQ